MRETTLHFDLTLKFEWSPSTGIRKGRSILDFYITKEHLDMPGRSKYRNLILLGNGFDRWQHLPTSYDEFRKYYHANIDQILNNMRVKRLYNGLTPVELVYGDALNPSKLPDAFFWNLESSMAQIDDQILNSVFGKTRTGLHRLQKTVNLATEILQRAFSQWVKSIKIDEQDSGYTFGDDCYIINFNYTDTVGKRFGYKEENVYHIHGDATDPETIIVGHSTHPETAFDELMEQKYIHRIGGGKAKRLIGLYLVESVLHETDKGVQNNIEDLCEFMTVAGVHIEDFENIYVLGHSMSDVDIDYFRFLCDVTKKDADYKKSSYLWKAKELAEKGLSDDRLFEDIALNIQYASHHRERELKKAAMSFPAYEAFEKAVFGDSDLYPSELAAKAKAAVNRRYTLEQAASTREVMDELAALKGLREYPGDCWSILQLADYIDGGHDPRTADAKWHISCRSEESKIRMDEAMKKIGCKNYTLYRSIDECIASFAVEKP